MLFEQGDLIELSFDPMVGHEPQKRRPALVVSVGHFNNVVSSVVVVCPITSAANKHPLHIELPDGLPMKGYVCMEAMRALDLNNPGRAARHLDSYVDHETMSKVLDAIGAVFDNHPLIRW